MLKVLYLLVYIGSVACRTFTYYDYAQIKEKIFELQDTYPELIKVTTAQEEYGLASPGSCGVEECKQYIVHMTNFQTYQAEKQTRPEVFFSGCLHGDERVGPTSVVETLILLAESYSSGNNPWLKRLVDTRSIWVMPSPNALGYFQDRRTENGIDPNRDFAYDRTADQSCMNSITARSLNELWREHMFQIAITFHSGIRMIGYEWGDNSNGFDYTSPDQNAQANIGAAFSSYAGKFDSASRPSGVPNPELYDRLTYPQGPITPLLYPVGGGMEDWGYAGSWAPNKHVCKPTQNGDYPVEKTTYSDSQLRVYNILVESSTSKSPRENTLGTTDELLKPTGKGQGHLPRHVRLVLTAIEAVQPYLKIVGFNSKVVDSNTCTVATTTDLNAELVNTDDVFGTEIVVEAAVASLASISYEIGGSFKVSSTKVTIYEKPSWWRQFEPITQETLKSLGDYEVFRTSEVSGYTRWAGGGLFGSQASSLYQNINMDFVEVEFETADGIDDREHYPFIPAWKFCFSVPATPGEYLIIADAIVDQDWNEVPKNATPSGYGVQAHLAQARTNTSWVKENAGFRIEGQVEWVSSPITLRVVEDSNDPGAGGGPADLAEDNQDKNTGFFVTSGILLSTLAVGLIFFGVKRLRSKNRTPVNREPETVNHYLLKEENARADVYNSTL